MDRKFLLLLFVLSFLVRGIVFSGYLSKSERYWNLDSPEYHNPAVSLAEGNGFTNTDGTLHFHRLPGYALFLSLCYRVFGVDKIKALWVQIVIASFIPILIYFLSLSIFPGSFLLAKLASFCTVFHMGYILFSGLFMSETLFSFFFLLFLILFFPSFNLFFINQTSLYQTSLCQTSLYMGLSGLFLGIASIMRPVGPPVMILVILFILLSNTVLLDKVKNIVMVFLGWFSVIGVVLFRNFLLTGYIFLSTLSGTHFLKHTVARIAMDKDKTTYLVALHKVNNKFINSIKRREAEEGRNLMDIEKCIIAEKMAINSVFSGGIVSIRHIVSNIFKTCFSLYSSELLLIESGGVLPTYDLSRTWVSKFKRFLVPDVSSNFIKIFIYLEILFHLFLVIGFFSWIFISLIFISLICISIYKYKAGLYKTGLYKTSLYDFNVLFKVLPFIGVLVFITFACGFARLRLPVEPFLIILSLRFWISLIQTGLLKREA